MEEDSRHVLAWAHRHESFEDRHPTGIAGVAATPRPQGGSAARRKGRADQRDRRAVAAQVLGLSVDLGARVAIVQAGRVPETADDPRAPLLTEALRVLGRHGERIGSVLALETGLESGAVLGAFLDRFDTGGLGVNLDPANLLMSGFDPYESARALHGRVVHSNAKDARVSRASRTAQEVPLGHGDIDWTRYLGALEEIQYRGWLTVAREGGDNRIADVAAGIGFLARFMGSTE